mgnify:CR=1 FL=1
MNNDYEQAVWIKGQSVFRELPEWERLELTALRETPLIKAFLADDDIQEITFASRNLGMVWTYQKRYRREP